MSNQDTKRLAAAMALRSAFRTEALEEAPSNEDISEFLVANGEDPDAVAKLYQSLIAEKIRAAKKERMQGFRRQGGLSVGFALRGVVASKPALPDVNLMRKRIEEISSSPSFDKSKLAIAYRNGTQQSDGDISSLYQDLLDLGVISDDSN
jgi:predicted RNA binding protein with dsRBD fold (UPF0201 family)